MASDENGDAPTQDAQTRAQNDCDLKILVVVFVPHVMTMFLLNKVACNVSGVTFGSTVSVLS